MLNFWEGGTFAFWTLKVRRRIFIFEKKNLMAIVKSSTTKIILFHLIIWVVLSVGYFFLAESITKLLFPDYDNVEFWLMVLILGLIIISFTVMLSLSIRVWRRGKRMN